MFSVLYKRMFLRIWTRCHNSQGVNFQFADVVIAIIHINLIEIFTGIDSLITLAKITLKRLNYKNAHFAKSAKIKCSHTQKKVTATEQSF